MALIDLNCLFRPYFLGQSHRWLWILEGDTIQFLRVWNNKVGWKWIFLLNYTLEWKLLFSGLCFGVSVLLNWHFLWVVLSLHWYLSCCVCVEVSPLGIIYGPENISKTWVKSRYGDFLFWWSGPALFLKAPEKMDKLRKHLWLKALYSYLSMLRPTRPGYVW